MKNLNDFETQGCRFNSVPGPSIPRRHLNVHFGSEADIAERNFRVRFVPLTEVGSPSAERPQDSELTLPHGLHRLIHGSYRVDSEVAFHLEPFPHFIRSRS